MEMKRIIDLLNLKTLKVGLILIATLLLLGVFKEVITWIGI